MWLSRFSRAFASARAKGISSERSAERSPTRLNLSSSGTRSLIPTPSSAVSHITPPRSLIPQIICLFFFEGSGLRGEGKNSQTMFLHPVDDLDPLGEPNIRKRLGVLDRLVVNPSGRGESHLAMHRQ